MAGLGDQTVFQHDREAETGGERCRGEAGELR